MYKGKRIPQYILSDEDFKRIFLSEIKRRQKVYAKNPIKKRKEINNFKKQIGKQRIPQYPLLWTDTFENKQEKKQ